MTLVLLGLWLGAAPLTTSIDCPAVPSGKLDLVDDFGASWNASGFVFTTRWNVSCTSEQVMVRRGKRRVALRWHSNADRLVLVDDLVAEVNRVRAALGPSAALDRLVGLGELVDLATDDPARTLFAPGDAARWTATYADLVDAVERLHAADGGLARPLNPNVHVTNLRMLGQKAVTFPWPWNSVFPELPTAFWHAGRLCLTFVDWGDRMACHEPGATDWSNAEPVRRTSRSIDGGRLSGLVAVLPKSRLMLHDGALWETTDWLDRRVDRQQLDAKLRLTEGTSLVSELVECQGAPIGLRCHDARWPATEFEVRFEAPWPPATDTVRAEALISPDRKHVAIARYGSTYGRLGDDNSLWLGELTTP